MNIHGPALEVLLRDPGGGEVQVERSQEVPPVDVEQQRVRRELSPVRLPYPGVVVQRKPLEAAKVELLAGKGGGLGVLADGLSLFGMDYAHRAGRREPLRAMAADLSDWAKAPPCPPDRVLIDPRTGRIRFFAGDDPARFQSKVVARFRGTHGDSAITRWRGNVLFLSHWESSYHVWAYDVADPAAPVKVGEIPVANFAHGFVLLDSGWALMGTTDPRGVFLPDLRDPRHMKVVRPVVPQCDWLSLVTPRYVAAWQGRRDRRDSTPEPRVFDVSRLPDELTEVTASVKPEVRPYLAGRIGAVGADGAGWFRLGDGSLARIDLKGEPAAWKVTRTVKLPAVEPDRRSRGERIRLHAVTPGRRFVLLYTQAGGGSVLQVLDVSGQEARFLPPIDTEPTAANLSVLSGRYAYVSVPPRNRGGGIIGTWEGTFFGIYDLSVPDKIRRAGKWDPGFPTRNMRLSPLPGRKPLVLIEEDSTSSPKPAGSRSSPATEADRLRQRQGRPSGHRGSGHVDRGGRVGVAEGLAPDPLHGHLRLGRIGHERALGPVAPELARVGNCLVARLEFAGGRGEGDGLTRRRGRAGTRVGRGCADQHRRRNQMDKSSA